ncbi:MAG: NFACT RNA binding domain-containing protein [Oscillospiraceae bacterium]
MALDAITMALLAKELDGSLQGARVDKIHQPSKDEAVLYLRKRDGNTKLLISARSGSARICLTDENFENPQTPPSFCMLLRKYLSGAHFIKARSVPGERIITLSFTATSEMGDTVNIDVAIELMGRYTNIVVINGEGKVVDALKRVDADASNIRQLLPGVMYKLPPNRDNPTLMEQPQEVIDRAFTVDAPLNTAIMKSCQGIGPVIAREISFRALGGRDVYANCLDEIQKAQVITVVGQMVEQYNHPRYTTVFDGEGKPCEFSFMPLTQYVGLEQREYNSLNDLLCDYYSKKDQGERLRQKGKDLYKLTQNLIDRTQRKQAARRDELADSIDSDRYRLYGELLTANIYKTQRGMKSVTVENYYTNEDVSIPLDVKLNGTQNAQKYYKEYKKRQTAIKVLTTLIAQGDIELEYLKTIAYGISEAQCESELGAIRSELQQSGYIKIGRQKEKKPKPQDFIRYTSSDGFLILVGRNNLQNDKLTMKTARGRDLWFHVKKAPGSHVVVVSEGEDIPLATQNEAAMIAVVHSSQKDAGKVAVDYTFVKNIKKTGDLKPGMVIYDTNESAYVTPDMQIIAKLDKKD